MATFIVARSLAYSTKRRHVIPHYADCQTINLHIADWSAVMTLSELKIDIPSVIDRMRESVGVSTDLELSEKIGVSNKTVSSWKSRESIPLEILAAVSFSYNVSMDYLLTGHESRISIDNIEKYDAGIMSVYSLLGEHILKSILSKYSYESLMDLEANSQVGIEGKRIGMSILMEYEALVSAKQKFVDGMGMALDDFNTFVRSRNVLPSGELLEDVRKRRKAD